WPFGSLVCCATWSGRLALAAVTGTPVCCCDDWPLPDADAFLSTISDAYLRFSVTVARTGAPLGRNMVYLVFIFSMTPWNTRIALPQVKAIIGGRLRSACAFAICPTANTYALYTSVAVSS